jgi:hypothetical protein
MSATTAGPGGQAKPDAGDSGTTGPSDDAGAAPRKKMTVMSVLPLVALSLSLVSLYISETARRDVARIDVIKTEYGLFQDLARLQLDHPRMAHLFAVTGQAYDRVVQDIGRAERLQSESDVVKLRLEEQAIAHFIFVAYEQTFYVSQETNRGERQRAALAGDDLYYFDKIMCNNPRLLWYWDMSEAGGKLGNAFGEELKLHHHETVRDCPTTEDPVGPFTLERR